MNENWDQTYDIVVVGGGTGLFAAIAAARMTLASGPTTGASAAPVADVAAAVHHGADDATHAAADGGGGTHPAEPRDSTPELVAAAQSTQAGATHCPETPGPASVGCVGQDVALPPLLAVLPEPLPSLAPLAAAPVARLAPDVGHAPPTPSPLFLGISRT